MPLNFKNPQGQTITVNSPDGSMPSESELDQMFAQKYPNENPSVTENPGSHPTYGAPVYNNNPFTAFAKGAYQGGSDVVNTLNNLRMKMPGQGPLGDTVPNPLFNGLRNMTDARPGTGAGISQDIGKSVVSSAPVMAGGMFGPVGMGSVGAAEAYANNQNPAQAFVQNALLGKAWELSGKLGAKAFVDTATKLGVSSQIASQEFLKRAGSSFGGGMFGAASSGGDPSSIVQGAGFNALYPQEPFKKSDVIPSKVGNPIAYSMMKGYMLPWAKDFKYMHDPVKGWLDEGLTANNIQDAAQQASQRKSEIGQQIGQTIQNSSQAGVKSDYSKVLSPIDDQIAQLNKSPKSNASIITRLQNAKDDLSSTLQKNPNMTPQEAFDFKQQVDDLTKWTGNSGDDKPTNSALQDTYRNIRNILNTQVPELKDFNQRYGNLSEATKRLQYRADASNPLLNFGKSAWDLGVAGVLGHGNPIATAALMAGESALRSGAVKTRVSNMLYSKPDFAGVPPAGQKSPVLGLTYNPSQIPNYLQNRQNIPNQGIPPATPMRPIPNESGIDQFSTPKEVIPLKEMFPEIKKQAKDLINEHTLGHITSQFNPLNTAKIAIPSALVAGAFGSQAEASTIGKNNNNPINLKAFEKWDGMSGKDKFGHAQFKTLDMGIRAGLKNLGNHIKSHPDQTLDQYFRAFAEKNGPQEAKFIADHLGIDTSTPLSEIAPEDLIIPLAKFESKINLTPEQVISIKKKYKI